jgi:prepilin-type processing-associated H-X9-DG protein
VTLAWAILGAAAAVSLMYIPAVYEGRCPTCDDRTGRIYLSRRGIVFFDGHVRVLGEVVYEERSQEREEVGLMVDQWHRRVAGRFAGLGALAGAVFGWREQRRARHQKHRLRGGWLGVAVAAVVFGALVLVGVPGEYRDSPWRWWRDYLQSWVKLYGWTWSWDGLGAPAARDGLRLLLPAAAIGWAAQTATAARGVRLFPGRPPEQAEDYADGRPAAPAR